MSGWLLVFARGTARKRVFEYDETWLAGLKIRAEGGAAPVAALEADAPIS
jgi:hypothetical protein